MPISISAYGSEFIEDSGVDTLQDIALYSPNFNISTSSSAVNQRITIRGVGSVANNALEPSVGVFIDGIYYPRTGSVISNLIALEAIEVLRGPQGTLFGRNLGDEGYCVNIFDQPFGGSLGGVDASTNTAAQRCVVGAPQTWGVEFKIRR